MKTLILAVLLLCTAFIPFLVESSTYGRPYGSTDETEMERNDVKSIDQINRSTSIDDDERAEPAGEAAIEPTESEPQVPPEETPAASEGEPPPPSLENPAQ